MLPVHARTGTKGHSSQTTATSISGQTVAFMMAFANPEGLARGLWEQGQFVSNVGCGSMRRPLCATNAG